MKKKIGGESLREIIYLHIPKVSQSRYLLITKGRLVITYTGGTTLTEMSKSISNNKT